MTSLPLTTRRFLAAVRPHPERYGCVMTHLYELRGLLIHGLPEQHGPVHTDWWRIHQLAIALHEEARRTNIREAVALFTQLREMAEHAIDGLHKTHMQQEQAVA